MPTPQELHQGLTAKDSIARSAALAIVVFARSLVPTLRDAGREHSAKELERLLFEYDAAAQDVADWAKGNMDSIMELLTSGGSKR